MTSKELSGRIKKFVLETIFLLRSLPKTQENIVFAKQLIRSVSSIGANYAEAIFADTKLDFTHIINICRKEAHETVYWLDLLAEINPSLRKKFDILIDEGIQIVKIFVSSIKTAKGNSYEK